MKDPMNEYRGMRVSVADGRAEVSRVTREAEVKVSVGRGERREPSLATGLAFFDHMLEMIAWHGGLNLDVTFAKKTYALRHVVTEDTGWRSLGVNALLRVRWPPAPRSRRRRWRGRGARILRALVRAARALIDMKSPGSQLEWVETCSGRTGRVRGCPGRTLHDRLKVSEGKDPHRRGRRQPARSRCVAPVLGRPVPGGLTAGVKDSIDDGRPRGTERSRRRRGPGAKGGWTDARFGRTARHGGSSGIEGGRAPPRRGAAVMPQATTLRGRQAIAECRRRRGGVAARSSGCSRRGTRRRSMDALGDR
jgi:hypothetical protein